MDNSLDTIPTSVTPFLLCPMFWKRLGPYNMDSHAALPIDPVFLNTSNKEVPEQSPSCTEVRHGPHSEAFVTYRSKHSYWGWMCPAPLRD